MRVVYQLLPERSSSDEEIKKQNNAALTAITENKVYALKIDGYFDCINKENLEPLLIALEKINYIHEIEFSIHQKIGNYDHFEYQNYLHKIFQSIKKLNFHCLSLTGHFRYDFIELLSKTNDFFMIHALTLGDHIFDCENVFIQQLNNVLIQCQVQEFIIKDCNILPNISSSFFQKVLSNNNCLLIIKIIGGRHQFEIWHLEGIKNNISNNTINVQMKNNDRGVGILYVNPILHDLPGKICNSIQVHCIKNLETFIKPKKLTQQTLQKNFPNNLWRSFLPTNTQLKETWTQDNDQLIWSQLCAATVKSAVNKIRNDELKNFVEI